MGLSVEMLFILEIVIFYTPIFCFAYVDLPLKDFRDGSKSAFIQSPYINIAQNTEKESQTEMNFQWPKGIVSYYVDNQTYDKFIKSSIHTAMKLIEADSCIRFKEEPRRLSDNKTWIHITNPNNERECIHEPRFKRNGNIILVLGYDCLKYNDILHSLLHGIGFKDEVTHPQRDKYIRVLWSNILPAYRHLFRKQSMGSTRNIVEYDPLSIMQFHDRAFSMNGRATVMPLEPGLIISPSEGLSQLDRMRLQLYFGHECNKRKVNDLLNSCKMTLTKEGKKLKETGSDENADAKNSAEDRKSHNNNDDDVNSNDDVDNIDSKTDSGHKNEEDDKNGPIENKDKEVTDLNLPPKEVSGIST